MARKADWPWWQQYTGSDEYRIRELLRAILDLNAYYGETTRWMWRGQANSKFVLNPAIHTRISLSGQSPDDALVKSAAERLLAVARQAGLDSHEGTKLPDMALLAMLQHYGAATPLLDVSLDPLVGLYMAVVSKDGEQDGEDGVLFAIKRPDDLAAQPFDTRPFSDVYDGLRSDRAYFYAAPDVSERLKIQRGHFLLAVVSNADSRVGLPLTVESGGVAETWLAKRMAQRGISGKQVPSTTDIAAFRVPKQFKAALRTWLERRTDLTYDYVYPAAWHRPHLESFCRSHGRSIAV